MSSPKPPYYYDKEKGIYHWEVTCSSSPWDKCHYHHKGWEKTNSKPAGAKKCEECSRFDVRYI